MNLQLFLFFSTFLSVSILIHTYLIWRMVGYGGGQFSSKYFLLIIVYCTTFLLHRIFSDYLPLPVYRQVSQIYGLLIAPVFFAIPLVMTIDLLLGVSWLSDQSGLLPAILPKLTEHRKLLSAGVVSSLVILVVLGHFLFLRPIEVKQVEIKSAKIKNEYKFLHITDLQFGTASVSHVKKIAAKIKEICKEYSIDFIVNTGDQIDTSRFSAEDIDLHLPQKTPVYFSLGNHEFYHNLERILGILQDQDYKILRNQNVTYQNEINIIGIDDSNDSNQVRSVLTSNQNFLIKPEYFNILGYHRPRGIEAAKEKGVDLMLSGHTHGGQVFPYTHLMNLIYDVPRGLTRIDDFKIFVSDGATLWGPRMRLGSRNQIVLFHLRPLSEELSLQE